MDLASNEAASYDKCNPFLFSFLICTIIILHTLSEGKCITTQNNDFHLATQYSASSSPQQCNDVMLMCYLSTITKGANSLNEVR